MFEIRSHDSSQLGMINPEPSFFQMGHELQRPRLIKNFLGERYKNGGRLFTTRTQVDGLSLKIHTVLLVNEMLVGRRLLNT